MAWRLGVGCLAAMIGAIATRRRHRHGRGGCAPITGCRTTPRVRRSDTNRSIKPVSTWGRPRGSGCGKPGVVPTLEAMARDEKIHTGSRCPTRPYDRRTRDLSWPSLGYVVRRRGTLDVGRPRHDRLGVADACPRSGNGPAGSAPVAPLRRPASPDGGDRSPPGDDLASGHGVPRLGRRRPVPVRTADHPDVPDKGGIVNLLGCIADGRGSLEVHATGDYGERAWRSILGKQGRTLEDALAKEAAEIDSVHRAVSAGLRHLLPYLSDAEPDLGGRWRRPSATTPSTPPGCCPRLMRRWRRSPMSPFGRR